MRGEAAGRAVDAAMATEFLRAFGRPAEVAARYLLNIPLLITAIVHGHWSVILRRIETGLSLATCAVLAWAVLDGPVVNAAGSDRFTRFVMVVIVAVTLIHVGLRLHRSVRPTPDRQTSG